jgi:tetratricopeptide (TPR) repeat protein
MNPLQILNQGMKLLMQGQVQQAAKISSQMLIDAPELVQVHYFACELAIARNQLEQALGHINRAIEINDREPALKFKKAQVEIVARQGLRAQSTASAVAELNPENPAVQIEAARVFSQCDNHAGAESFLLRARDMGVKTPGFLFELAKNQFYLGKTLEAESAISEYLDLGMPNNGPLLLLRAKLQRQTQDKNHVEMLRKHLTRQLPDEDLVNCYFALAKELEDLGEYYQSFKALKSGSEIQRRLIQYNLSDELANMEDMVKTFQPADFAAIPDSMASDSPVFIIGMPRTGTTLVERIIGKIEGVKSAGETYDFTLAMSSVINQYIAANPGKKLSSMSAALKVNYNDIALNYKNNMRGMVGEAEQYLDKLPFNFLYCGLIKKAFPRARIIHLVRDPMDTCYAVYKTLFYQTYHFSYDLDELADYYIAYRKLMDHWRHLMPGVILDIHYEELVSNPRETSRRIADYCGYDWSEELIEVQNSVEASSTASAAQVREPIYTSSVQIWRNYEAELSPLKEKLLAANMMTDNSPR